MFQDKKTFSFSRGFLLVFVIINVIVIKIAYTNNQDFYWLLLLLIPALVFVIYYERIISQKAIKNRKINDSNFKIKENDQSIFPRGIKSDGLKVLFGNSYCTQRYLSSIICFESVSAGQNIKYIPKQIVLSEDNDYVQDMMQRLNEGLFINDSIWRIGPDYAGCRDYNFKFHAEAFKINAVRPNVKMIELKLSGFNDRANIFARKISYSKQTSDWKHTGSNVKHTAFSNAESMVIFLDSLRQLSGKKPVGISICIKDKKEFYEMCYAFCKTHIIPDFIVVEGCGKENIMLNNMTTNHGIPLFEALLFVSKTLEQCGLSKEIKIIAASEINTAFDVLKLRALGADAISMRNCLTSGDKPYQTDGIGSTRFSPQCMEKFRTEILNSTIDIMQAWGYKNIKDITLASFFRSLDALNSKGVNKEYDPERWDISDRKTYRLSQENFYEKNTSSYPSVQPHFFMEDR